MFPDEFIDKNAAHVFAGLDHDDDAILVVFGFDSFGAEKFPKAEDRGLPPPNADNGSAFVNRGDHADFWAKGFADGNRRNDVTVISNTHHEAINDGEREREKDGKSGAFSENGLDFHFAT